MTCSDSRPQARLHPRPTDVSGLGGSAVGIIGAGRAGSGLAVALAQAGYAVRLNRRRPIVVPSRRAPPSHPLLTLSVGPGDTAPPWIADVPIVVLAVPDDAIRDVAAMLARAGVGRAHVVLHLSGVLGREALSPLESNGAALGSLHPLQTLVDPDDAPGRLRGAWAAVEGSERAVETAQDLARALGMHPFVLPAGAKGCYHAAAVFSSNYLVVLQAVAQRLLVAAGLNEDDAWRALQPLVEGTVGNLARLGPLAALTGPVARGDADTIARHRAALGPDDAALYVALGRVALGVARRRGLDGGTADRVARALATDPPRERPEEEKT